MFVDCVIKDEQGLCRLEVPHFVYQYYKQLYGSVKIADMQASASVADP